MEDKTSDLYYFTHRVAADDNGEQHRIGSITDEHRRIHRYFCLGCGDEMEACLCGNKRESYFRHKSKDWAGRCNPETALHKYAKKVLADRFMTQPTFEVAYYIQNDCPLVDTCQIYKRVREKDKCSGYALRTFDLKKEYDTCEIEGSYNGYRADVLLTNSQNPDVRPIFLEISVSHDCSPEKIEAGCQIIEMKITHENDLDRPIVETRDESHNLVRFYNFEWVKQLSDTFVFDRMLLINGKFYKGMGVVCGEMETKRPHETQFEVSVISNTCDSNTQSISDLQSLAFSQAFLYKMPISHCFFCGASKRCRGGYYGRFYRRPEDVIDGFQLFYNNDINGGPVDKSNPSSRCCNWRVDEKKCKKACDSFSHRDVYVWIRERANEYLPMKNGFYR